MPPEETAGTPATPASAEGAPAAPVPSPEPGAESQPPPAPTTEPVAAPDAPAPAEPAEPAQPSETEPSSPHEGAEKLTSPEPAPPERPKTLLAEATAETPPEAQPKPDEPVPEPKPEAGEKPAYEAFTLPEGVKLDQSLMGNYTETLGKYGVPQEGGQALLDLHISEMQRLADHQSNEQWRVFNETVNNWRTETMADEVLGGAGHQTAMGIVKDAVDKLTEGNEQHRTALLQIMDSSGLGNHPAVLRFLYNVGRKWASPGVVKETTTDIKPPPDRGGAVRPSSRTGTLYPNTNFTNGSGR